MKHDITQRVAVTLESFLFIRVLIIMNKMFNCCKLNFIRVYILYVT